MCRYRWAALVLLPLIPSAAMAETRLDLDACVRRALESNRGMQIQRELEEKAGYRVREAWAGAFPQINFGGSVAHNFQIQSTVITAPDSTGELAEQEITFGAENELQAAFQLRQPIWVGGKVGAAVRGARHFSRQSAGETSFTEQGVVLQAKALYYTAVLQREEIAAFLAARDRAARSLEMTELRAESGLLSDFEVLRARTELANLQVPLMNAESAFEEAIDRLQVFLALPMAESVILEGDLDYMPVPAEAAKRRHSLAKEIRPDWLALNEAVGLQKQLLRIARGDRFPSFYLTGSYGWFGFSDDFQFNDISDFSTAAVEVSFPIWTSGATTARVRQARSDLAIVHLQLEQLDSEIEREVREAENAMRTGERRVEATGESWDLAKRAAEIAELRFENGLLSQVALLDAQDSLTEARVAHLRALSDALIARASWERAVGHAYGEPW